MPITNSYQKSGLNSKNYICTKHLVNTSPSENSIRFEFTILEKVLRYFLQQFLDWL